MRRVWFACTVVRYCGCCFGVESHVAAPILLDLCVSVDCFQGGSRSLPFGKAFHLSCKGTSAKRASGRHIPLPNTAPPRRPLPRRQRPARCRSLVPKLWHLAFHVFSPTCMQRCRLVLSALAASACNPALAWNPEPRLKSGGFVELALPKLMHCSLVERERHASCSPPAGTSNCSFSLFGSELRRRWSGLGHLGALECEVETRHDKRGQCSEQAEMYKYKTFLSASPSSWPLSINLSDLKRTKGTQEALGETGLGSRVFGTAPSQTRLAGST